MGNTFAITSGLFNRPPPPLHFLPVTDFPNIPRPRNSIETTVAGAAAAAEAAAVEAGVAAGGRKIPLPTRSVGSLVDATPSVSSLALTTRSSPAHHTPSRPYSTAVAVVVVVVVVVVVIIADAAAPSGVISRDVSSKSNGKPGFGYLADRTGGGLPRLPSSTAAGTLSGLLGLAVTYSAAPLSLFAVLPAARTSSNRSGDCSVARPRTYTFPSSVAGRVDEDGIGAASADNSILCAVATAATTEVTTRRREDTGADDERDPPSSATTIPGTQSTSRVGRTERREHDGDDDDDDVSPAGVENA